MGFLGCWLLCSFLGCRFFCSLLYNFLWFLDYLLFLWLLNFCELEGSLDRKNSLGSQHLPDGKLDTDGSFLLIPDLVVGKDRFEDGLAGGTTTFLQGSDGSRDHSRERRMGGPGSWLLCLSSCSLLGLRSLGW